MTSHLLLVSTVAVIDSSPLAFIPALLLPQWLTGPEMQKDPIHRPAIGLKRKKAAHMAVQGETAATSTAVSPCVLQSNARQRDGGLLP